MVQVMMELNSIWLRFAALPEVGGEESGNNKVMGRQLLAWFTSGI